MSTRHALTILAVNDLDAMRAFYQTVFAWPATVDVPVYVEFTLPDSMRLGLYRREALARITGRAATQVPAGELSPTELYFYSDDLEALLDRAEVAGARPLSALAARDWGDEVAYFADPEGNVLALARSHAV